MAPPPSLKRLSSTSSQYTTPTPRLSLSTINPNIFSDENALEPANLTPDSASSLLEGNRALQTSSDPSQPPVQVHRQSNLIEDLAHERGSTGENELSIGLRREGSSARHPHYRTNAGSLSEMSKGSISSTSAFAMPRTQSPYQGATGPSHPYGMYPQDIGISRSPSAATIPSARAPERIYPGGSGPTQPYGMYPQNTVPEDDIILGAEVAQPMPGFPGRERNYQRRFGPDSDEAADIVGPDGYTEQLPAYTRYANDIPPKAGNPTPGTPRGEPHNQPGESRDTLHTITPEDSDPRSPAVEDSSTRLSAPATEITTAPSEVNPSSSACIVSSSEGGHFKERVKERGKRRVCFGRLPMWLCMVFLVVGACVVGGMIGGILGRAKATSEGVGSPFSPATLSLPTVTATVTTTSLVDAEPISSPPAGLPTPIPGTYTVPLQNATTVSDECLQDLDQVEAWGCTSGALMELHITIVDSDPVVLLNYTDYDGPLDPTLSNVRFGAQPPILNDYTTMSPMNAKDHLDKGPAYVFHKQFDKLVILPQDTFDSTQSWRQRRDNTVNQQSPNYTAAIYAPRGHKPWFCYWNGTLLEGFIFVTQNIATHKAVVQRSDFSAYMDTSNVSTLVTPDDSSTSVTPGDYSATATSLIGSFSGLSSTTDTSEVSASSTTIPAPPDGSLNGPVSSTSDVSDIATAIPAPSDGISILQPSYDRYPTVMKVEERRNLGNEVSPYCQQMLIMEDGSVQSIGLPKINLTVEEYGDIQSRRSKKRGESWKKLSILGKREDDSACGCEWILDGP